MNWDNAAPTGGVTSPEEILTGKVVRVIFQNQQSAFVVLQVKTGKGQEPVTVVGNMDRIEEGVEVRARGRWGENPKFGRQFQASVLELELPSTKEGLKRFLVAKQLLRLSHAMADRIIARFGEATLEVIEQQPQRLLEIPGFGKKRLSKMVGQWGKFRALRNLMLFCQEHGLSAGQAMRIHDALGDLALRRVKEDPYLLCRQVQGIGFKTADQLALRLGWPPDSPTRILAGLSHVLYEASGVGHCALPRERHPGELHAP